MARRQDVLGMVRYGARPSSRVSVHALPFQRLLCGGHKRGLHAFQGGQRHHERLGASEEENGGGGAGGKQLLENQLW